MIRLYRFPPSTNVERVELALAHKKLRVEKVDIDPADRTEVRRLSGQDLVPVLVDEDGTVVHDSMEIVRHLEKRYPAEPLYPSNPARRAETFVFIDWFNRVWKRPPNDMEAEMKKPSPDVAQIEKYSRAMAHALYLFDGMLTGRKYIMGEEFSAADCCAFPFLKYATIPVPPDDDELFHRILVEHQRLNGKHQNVAAWITRCDERPRA
jgi:glutathione S-transferase